MMQKIKPFHRLLVALAIGSACFMPIMGSATNISTPTAGPQTTSNPNNLLHILSTGQIYINSATYAADINTTNGKIIIDANNSNVTASPHAAIYAPAAGGGDTISILGPNALVSIGAQSGVVDEAGPNGAINIVASNAKISNAGNISSGISQAINIVGGHNTSITNALHAKITSADSGSGGINTIDYANTLSTGFNLSNSGVISTTSSAGGNAISLNGSFNQIINQSSGHILASGSTGTSGSALLIPFNATGGNRIINEGGGLIEAGENSIYAVSINAPVNQVINQGVIQSTASNTTMDIETTINQAFINTGDINNLSGGEAVYMRNDNGSSPAPAVVNTFINTGDIVSSNDTTVYGYVQIPNGFYNMGNIVNTGADGVAVLFIPYRSAGEGGGFAGPPSQVSFYQKAGLIDGEVQLAAFDSHGGPNVFTLSGGMISGNVIASVGTPADNLASSSQYTHLLQGGTLMGQLQLGTLGDTVILAGASVDQIIGNSNGTGADHFILKSGSFNFIQGNAANLDEITVPNSFVSTGYIESVPYINVENSGTVFTIGHLINNLNGSLNTGKGTTTIQQAPIQGLGIIQNSGTFQVQGNQIISMTAFDNLAGGSLSLGAYDTLMLTLPNTTNAFHGYSGSSLGVNIAASLSGTTNSKILVDNTLGVGTSSILLATGSKIAPTFSGVIHEGSTYPVVWLSSMGSHITDNSTVQQPASVIVYFTKSLNTPQNVLSLIAHRNSYQSLSSTSGSFGVAGALDQLALGNGPGNSDLYYALSQLDQSTTQQTLELAMESLAPPFNYGLIDGAHTGFFTAIDNITERIWDFAWAHRFMQTDRKSRHATSLGLNSGDWMRGIGVWAMPMAAYVTQHEHHAISGYRVNGGGALIGADYAVNACNFLGIAGSYFKATVDDKNDFPKNERVESWQVSAYGTTYMPSYGLYLDTIFAAAFDDFKINRTIDVNALYTAAQSSMSGSQWGVQCDLGWIYPSTSLVLKSPFVRLNYTQLFLDDYTESGAGGLNLQVNNQAPITFSTGVGIRLAMIYPWRGNELIPETDLLLGYDIVNDGEAPIANFLGGGPLFTTLGAVPSPLFFDIGFGFNLLRPNQTVLTAKYNMEIRGEYFANTGTLQYFWGWG